MELSRRARGDPPQRVPHRRRARERLARADARLGGPRPARRRGGRPSGDPRRLRGRGLGRLLRPRDLLRQRRLRQRVPRLALGRRRRRARAPRSGRLHPLLVEKEGRGTRRGPERRNMRVSKRARWALVIVAAAALVLAATAAARTHSAAKGPIVIGWAYDNKGPMQPFDTPALAAANHEVFKINKNGGVNGRQIVIKTCKTQGINPPAAKACADQLISAGAKIIFTTCDVDLAAPVVQESLNAHLLTVAPCIGTDQMGPKRFGSAGKLAFSFGNVAQDEGSAMAEVAWKHGWKTADLAKDSVIVYFKAVVSAFKARFKQLGGKINYETTYQDAAFGGNNVQNAVTGILAHPAKVVVTVTAGAYGSLGPFI